MNGSNSTSLYFKESLNYGWFNLPPPPTPPLMVWWNGQYVYALNIHMRDRGGGALQRHRTSTFTRGRGIILILAERSKCICIGGEGGGQD